MKKAPTPEPAPGQWIIDYVTQPGRTVGRVLRTVKEWFLGLVPELSIIIGILVIALIAIIVLRIVRDRRLARGARRIRVLPPPEIDPSGAKNLWMGLHAIGRPWWKRLTVGQPYVAWEVSAELHDADVAVWMTPTPSPRQVDQAIEASWQGSRVDQTAVPLKEIPGFKASCEVVLKHYEGLPLGEGAGGDRLRMVLGALAGLAQDEQAVVQILARPATGVSRLKLRRHAARMRQRERKRTRPNAKYVVAPNPTVESDARAIDKKAAEPLWHVGIRFMVTAQTKEAARGKINTLVGGLSVLHGQNEFARRRLRRGSLLIGRRRFRRNFILSASELAMIATLPSTDVLPFLDRARARTMPPPKELPWDGHVLGVSDHPSIERPVAIAPRDLCHHVHLMARLAPANRR